MIIDFHTHIFSPDVVRNRHKYFNDTVFSILYSTEKSRLADAEIMLGAMNESGIDYAVAMGFPWENKEYAEIQNSYLKDSMISSKGRIIPFGTVLLDNKNDIEDSVKSLKESGFAGIGEIAFYRQGLGKRNADMLEALLDSAGRHSMPVCVHVNEPVGHDYTGKHSTELSTLYPVLTNCSKTTTILAHWGGGLFFYELMKEVKSSLKNVFYDTAASPYLYKNKIYKSAIDITGSEKILFGSDFPLIDCSRYIDSINAFVPDKNDRKNILGGNAAKILNDFIKSS